MSLRELLLLGRFSKIYISICCVMCLFCGCRQYTQNHLLGVAFSFIMGIIQLAFFLYLSREVKTLQREIQIKENYNDSVAECLRNMFADWSLHN